MGSEMTRYGTAEVAETVKAALDSADGAARGVFIGYVDASVDTVGFISDFLIRTTDGRTFQVRVTEKAPAFK